MDPTKEENLNNIANFVEVEDSEKKFRGDNPNPIPIPILNPDTNEYNMDSTSNPPPAKKPHYFDLNLVYTELGDNDTKSEVVVPATATEQPEVIEPKENVNAYPENVEPDWDVGNEPTNVIDISDSDSEITHTSNDEKKTILFFKPEAADESPVHDWGGIVPFMPFVHDTEESSLEAPKRKFTNGLVKVKEEK